MARGATTKEVGLADLESAWPTWPEIEEVGLADWELAQPTLSRRPTLSRLTEGELDPSYQKCVSSYLLALLA